jgi:transposase-like protein
MNEKIDLKQRFVERHAGGRPTLYSQDYHIGLLYEVFVKGGTIEKYCLEASIGLSTFKDWRKKHRAFRTAFEEAKMLAHAYFQELVLNPPSTFNFSAYLHTIKVRFREPHEREVTIKMPKNGNKLNLDELVATTYKNSLSEFSKGRLTPKEFGEITSGLRNGLTISELVVIRKEIDELKAMFKGNT